MNETILYNTSDCVHVIRDTLYEGAIRNEPLNSDGDSLADVAELVISQHIL